MAGLSLELQDYNEALVSYYAQPLVKSCQRCIGQAGLHLGLPRRCGILLVTLEVSQRKTD